MSRRCKHNVNLPDEAFKDEDGNWIDLSGKTEWDNIFGFKVLKLSSDLVGNDGAKQIQHPFGRDFCKR